MIGKLLSRIGGAVLLAACLLGEANAQSFTENFDDITALAGNGWVTANNSAPVGALGWFQGTAVATSGPFDAYNGAANAYIAANFNSTGGSTGTISNWLMMPNRTLRNGDVLTFYTRKADPDDYPDRLELRLSTNGASTNAGASASASGDFATLLLSINPSLITGVYPTTWTQYTVTVSGLPAPTSGRMAFRYYVTNAGPTGTNSDYIGIDAVAYTPYACPTISLTPPGGPLSGGVTAQPFSTTLSQTGTLGAPTFSVTAGALPPGLTLSASGTISGTPTALGTFNFSVTVSDASGCSGTRSFSITVVAGPPPMPINAAAVAGDTTANVTWAAMSVDAYGTAITGYTVTVVGDASKGCTTDGSGSGCTVTGLTNGVSYSFSVVAASTGGTSPAAITNSVVPIGTQTINFPQPATQVYGGILTPQATASSGLPVTFSVSGPCQLQPSGDIQFTGVGACLVTASQAGNAAFAAAPDVPRTITVAKAGQSITFTSVAPTSPQIGGTYTVTATGGASGNPVTFSIASSTTANCSISGSTVNFVAVGPCTVDADQVGNANYSDAAQAQQSFGIAVVPQTINFPQPAPQVYGSSLTPQATASSGLPVSFAVSGQCQLQPSGALNFTGIGSCVVTASQAGNAGFAPAPDVARTVIVSQAAQSITFTSVAPTSPQIGGTYTVTATGGASGNPVTFSIASSTTANCSISGSTVNFVAAGPCTINANQVGNANYSAAAQAQQSFGIAVVPQTINFPQPAPQVYGSSLTPQATASSGLPVSFAVSGQCQLQPSGALNFTGIGSCVVTASQAGNAGFAPAPDVARTVIVSQAAQSITFTSVAPTSPQIGGTYTVTATGGASGNPVTFSIASSTTANCSISGSTVNFVAAGPCTINADEIGSTNFSNAVEVQQTFAIAAATALPAPAPVPAISRWLMIVLSSVVAGFALVRLRRCTP